MVSSIEGEVDPQYLNNVIDEGGEYQRQLEEEIEHHEEHYLESRSREQEGERISSSFELGVPRPNPLAIPDFRNTRAYIALFNSVPSPTS